jgi:lipoprotein-releasing system permease protein
MAFTPTIILRYLRARRGFTGVVTGFSVGGILLGVAALIVVMCVMAGFRDELVGRILNMTGHATLSAPGLTTQSAQDMAQRLAAIPAVQAAQPLVQGQVMLVAKGQATGGFLRGVQPSHIPQLVQDNATGTLSDLAQPNRIAVGEDMARQLRSGIGDVITLLSPDGAHTVFGFVPRMVQAKIVAVFDTGSSLYDRGLVLTSLKTAQGVFKLGQGVSALEIRVQNPLAIGQVAPELVQIAGADSRIITWQQSNRQFFNALQVERVTMFVILSLIILVAAFNIITGQIMLVGDKTADIAILRTMGATRQDILRIFLYNGLLLGILGTLGGLALGLLVTLNLMEIVAFLETTFGLTVFSGDVYPLDTVPARLVWPEISAVLAMSLLLTLLASLYPAWRASRLTPVEGLKHA